MAKVHGKETVVLLDTDDLSAYTSSCEFGRTADSHDVTTFGNDGHRYSGGLTDGSVTLEGVYESTSVAGGPRMVIEPLLGTTVEFVHRPEGTGSGLPEDAMDVVVTGYTETSPVADYRRWTATLQIDGDVTTAAQA